MSHISENKVLLIVNPQAGKRIAKGTADDLLELLQKSGSNVTLYITKAPKEATKLVKRTAGQYSSILCCGGDGTFNEVMTGILQSGLQIAIGYIPAGTTNDLAKSLRLPKNIKKSAAIIMTGIPVYHDIGRLNESLYFSYVASFGAFTKVSYATPQWLKNRFGHLAYIIDGIFTLGDIHPHSVKIKTPEQQTEGEFLFGGITNSTSIGGVLKFDSKAVQLNDGKFEVLLIRNPQNPVHLRNILHGLTHQKYDQEYVSFFHTDHIELEFAKKTAWTVDGEFAGDYTTVTIENLHNAVQIIVSDPAANKSAIELLPT